MWGWQVKLENATYIEDTGWRPHLAIFIDGRPARIPYEQKFLSQHVVFLGAGWEGVTEPITIPANHRDGRAELVLEGFVKDRRLAEMVRRFRALVDSGKFVPGPAEIPPMEVKY